MKFWNAVYEYLLGLLAAPRGADPRTVQTVVIHMGSGYSKDAERARNRAKLEAICRYVVQADEYQPRDGVTHCNQAVARVAFEMGCTDFVKSPMANQMVDIMASSREWRIDTGERAAAHALKGGFAVAGQKADGHGHVAVVFPYEILEQSGSWGKAVPQVANVGKTNAIMKCSMAFKTEPMYFLWGDV